MPRTVVAMTTCSDQPLLGRACWVSKVVVLAGSLIAAVPGATEAAEAASEQIDRDNRITPIVAELFTSQGCSSCPAADRLLSQLTEKAPPGTVIIALAFHVDYWNYIGWTDPFSSADWSRRQRLYARHLGADTVYTPQLVVNGRWQGVGSDSRSVTTLLEQARQHPGHGRVNIQASIEPGGRLHLSLGTRSGSQEIAGDLVLWLAVVESGFETPVGRGENARKTLHNDFVVRRLEPAFHLGDRLEGKRKMELELDSAWKTDNIHLTAFLQDSKTLHIHGAASTRPFVQANIPATARKPRQERPLSATSP